MNGKGSHRAMIPSPLSPIQEMIAIVEPTMKTGVPMPSETFSASRPTTPLPKGR